MAGRGVTGGEASPQEAVLGASPWALTVGDSSHPTTGPLAGAGAGRGSAW